MFVLVHEDDYVAVGDENPPRWLENLDMRTYHNVSEVLEPGTEDKTSIEFFYRVITFEVKGLMCESNP